MTITLKGLFLEYKVFISSFATRQTPSTFTNLDGILLQEEERMKIYEPKSQTANQALMERGRQSHRGKFHAIHRGMSHT